ncbi:hypothetical protein Q0A17_20755 [Citrobacter sp. S2-9]|uniref:Uncharacterized protein n=1 Tax=Citrobacter enshiensis TaxID=2971264 RepID=A0ABT8Q0N9_9ENTR|nr:hypothetical protein [Citrobacter enshiensis]MDN8601818.1 hypothetical protein [Citrobacter enshiensis]
MTHKVVSTLILSGHSEECKCEIYQHDTVEGPKFNACLYIRRHVLMVLEERPFSVRHSDAPTSKPVLTWVQARILNDIDVTSLEAAEATIKDRYVHEPFFIPAFFDSASLL